MNISNLNALQPRQPESLAQTKPSGYYPPTSFEDAVRRKQDAISVVRKDEGQMQRLILWVKARLIEVFSYLGAFDKVSEYQILTLAKRICDKFFYLTPAELDFFFVSFTNGEYRRLYNSSSVNPQDIMMSLIDYEKDLLVARGEAEKRRIAEEEARRKAEDAGKPHGLEAWKIYCRQHNLDPDTHRLPTVTLHKVDEELHPEQDKHNIHKTNSNEETVRGRSQGA